MTVLHNKYQLPEFPAAKTRICEQYHNEMSLVRVRVKVSGGGWVRERVNVFAAVQKGEAAIV